MPDTEPKDLMPFLRADAFPLHRNQPVQHHLGRQLRAMYDAVPLPDDPHLSELLRQLEAVTDTDV